MSVTEYFEVGADVRDTKAPAGPIERKWSTRKFNARLVNPANRRKLSIIVVGTGLAGGAAAATLGEAGYNVLNFCYQDSPRRAPVSYTHLDVYKRQQLHRNRRVRTIQDREHHHWWWPVRVAGHPPT